MFKYIEITNDLERSIDYFENELAYTMSPYDLEKEMDDYLNFFNLVDVRHYEDYISGHIPFAVHIPFENLVENLKIIDKSKPTIVYCYNATCHLGKKAALIMVQHGYSVLELSGGFESWANHGYEIVKTKANEG
ncbi:MAG: rhodanese-like domain-containing protein [Candidatus Gastranaerophilales bacterium]|nr:rhodanese-like domain-containing protein [Candidatus Gastranaerophilales bacterium]